MLQNSLIFFKQYRIAILLGVGCAVWFALNSYLLFGVLSFIGASAIFFSYLSYNQKGGLVSAVTATICLLPLVSLESVAHFFLNDILPTAILGHLLMRNIVQDQKIWWYPESFLLRDCTFVFSGIWLIMAYTLMPEATMMKLYETLMKILFQSNAEFFTKGAGAEQMRYMFSYSGGALTFCNMLEAAFNLEMAYAWGKKYKTNLRTSFDLLNLRIPNWMVLLPWIFLVLAHMIPAHAYLLKGLFIGTLFAPAICGLSIVYFIAEKKQKLRRLPMITIILVLLLPLHMIGLLVLLGMIDSFYQIRNRLTFE